MTFDKLKDFKTIVQITENTFDYDRTLVFFLIFQEQTQEKETELEPAHLQNTSTCSEWFNTTRDEMILFEKFGEDYDEIVNEMSHTG